MISLNTRQIMPSFVLERDRPQRYFFLMELSLRRLQGHRSSRASIGRVHVLKMSLCNTNCNTNCNLCPVLLINSAISSLEELWDINKCVLDW